MSQKKSLIGEKNLFVYKSCPFIGHGILIDIPGISIDIPYLSKDITKSYFIE